MGEGGGRRWERIKGEGGGEKRSGGGEKRGRRERMRVREADGGGKDWEEKRWGAERREVEKVRRRFVRESAWREKEIDSWWERQLNIIF